MAVQLVEKLQWPISFAMVLAQPDRSLQLLRRLYIHREEQ